MEDGTLIKLTSTVSFVLIVALVIVYGGMDVKELLPILFAFLLPSPIAPSIIALKKE